MTKEERSESRKTAAEGKAQFKKIRLWLEEVMSSPDCPILDPQIMRTIQYTGGYFTDVSGPIRSVEKIYCEKSRRDLRDAILLAAIVQALNTVIGD